MSIDRGTDKDVACVYVCMYVHMCVCTRAHTHTHTHTMEYYAVTKKNEIMPFAATQIGAEIIILSEVNQKRDKYHMVSLICRI